MTTKATVQRIGAPVDADNDAIQTKDPDTLETLVKGLALLRLFGSDVRELSIQDAADCLGLSRAAARRFLMTLEKVGYLKKDGRAYSLTPEVLKLGYSYFSSLDLPSIARPILSRLVEELDEPCGLCVLHAGEVVYLGGMSGKKAFGGNLPAGSFLPAYPTAAGRVLLGGVSDEELDAYLANDFPKLTPYTITEPDKLRASIEKARADGYSLVHNELAYGVGGIAVPVVDCDNRVRAALYIGMFRGVNPKAMTVNYLPKLKQAAEEVNAILQLTSGVPG
jgi:IclR family transcriptional regulator, pca regulon regulatory protein